MRLTKQIILSAAFMILSATAFGQVNPDRDNGILLYHGGLYSESIIILEKLVANGKADYSAGLYLGAGYVQTGKYKEARDILNKLRTLKMPESPLGYETKLKVLRKPQPVFGEAAKQSMSNGSIRVLVEFKQDGKIGFVFPFAFTSDKLIDGAITASKGVTFEPAVINGKHVNTVNILEYRFTRY
jgi:tetratricopeptide (TPR) repeat protein